MTEIKQKEYTVRLNTDVKMHWEYQDYASTCDPMKKSPSTERGWRITYVKHDIDNTEKTIYITHLEHYLQFIDLLEEAGYSLS